MDGKSLKSVAVEKRFGCILVKILSEKNNVATS